MTSYSTLLSRKGGIVIGLTLSVAAGLAQLLGWLEPINNFGFDFKCRGAGNISADPRIVMIEIDDGSIRAVGEYPWPRQFYAEILRELNRLGSKQVLLDVMLSEPTGWQVQHSALSTDFEPSLLELLDIEGPIADEDGILRQFSISQAFLPMGGVLIPSAAKSHANANGTPAGAYLDSAKEPTAEGFLETNLPAELRGIQSPERAELLRQFRAETARRAWLEQAIRLDNSCNHLPKVRAPGFPQEQFTRSAGSLGFVAYHRQEHSGVLREIPIAVRVEDRIVYQLALATVFNARRAFCEQNTLHLAAPPEERVIPLGVTGLTLINWVRPRGNEITTDGFARIPAARVLELAEKRQVSNLNQQMHRIRLLQLLKLRHAETPFEYQSLLSLARDLWKPTASVPDPEQRPEYYAQRRHHADQVKAAEDDAKVWLQRVHDEWSRTEPRDDIEQTQRDDIAFLHKWFFDEALQRDSQASARKLLSELTALEKELTPKIAGKICLVGYTATGVADLVTTPVHNLAPGLLAHANVANMVLQNRFLRALSPPANAGIVTAAALLAAMIACAANWRVSLLALLLIWGGMWLLGFAAFRVWGLHIAGLPAIAGAAVAWSGVTWYRQSTEERVRRRLQVALTQYTSPAIAAAIADRARPDLLLPSTATVTCFFSDLEGFTRLSEELGPERTRDVLNPYLELTSKILIEHGAIVNKFVGDGVFAFFNAPIRPCEDHARQACRAAQQLIRECPSIRARASAATENTHRLRIGLSTGEVFVGDYGSQAKLDYTCIGDTVNLGSRLEQLNKIFGTTVLLDGATRRLAGDEFRFRPLGLIRIHGREAAAEVHEIVPPEAPNSRFSAYFQSWESALTAYQACQWDSCTQALAACRAISPHDRALALYTQAVEGLRTAGAGAGWDGSLRLDDAK